MSGRTVFRHFTDEGARLRLDQLAKKEADQMSNNPYPHPRFPGKSRAYVDAYLAEEARSGASGRADVIQSREDAEARAVDQRVDAAASAASVSRQDVMDYVRMNHPLHRGYVPTEDDIANAVHAVRLRGIYKPGVE